MKIAKVVVSSCFDCPFTKAGVMKKTLHGKRFISQKCGKLNIGISKYYQKGILPSICPLEDFDKG